MIPTQVWYDNLRGNDDGSFSTRHSLNPNADIDQ